jgi:hypothetical protein
MRLLKFISAFLATALVLLVFVIGLNWGAFQTFLDNREAFMEGSEWVPKTQSLRGLTEYIEENPERASIASIVLEHPDSTLFFQADVPRPMGSLSDIFLLTAYAIEIDNGSVDGNQSISLDEINRFLLPEVHNSIHNDAITFAEQNGWIDDGTISTDHALTLLSYFNDPALADYLWWNLQPYDWESFKQNFELDVTEMPLPYSGLYLSISETITDDSIDSMIDQWGNQRVEYRSHVIELSDQFVNSESLRTEWSDELQNNRLGRSFMEERDALALFPRTTASEAVTFLKNLRNSEMISEDSAERVLNWMRAPYQDLSEITRDFTDYGALFDNRMGLLNGFDFGTLVYTGDTKVQAIFFDRLPIGFWFHMSGTHMHQDFQQRLIYDPALIDLMEKVSLRASQNEINNDVQLN